VVDAYQRAGLVAVPARRARRTREADQFGDTAEAGDRSSIRRLEDADVASLRSARLDGKRRAVQAPQEFARVDGAERALDRRRQRREDLLRDPTTARDAEDPEIRAGRTVEQLVDHGIRGTIQRGPPDDLFAIDDRSVAGAVRVH
jgi:hypothetical protein